METEVDIKIRMSRLENRNKIGLVAILICLVLIVLVSTSKQDEVRATSIKLVDSHGEVLAELAVRENRAGLYVMDEMGKTRIALFHASDSTGLYINDNDEVTRIGVSQFSHGGGGVALHGPESKGAAVLYFKNSGSLRFFDNEGRVINSISAESH